jgi:hypothetical protein
MTARPPQWDGGLGVFLIVTERTRSTASTPSPPSAVEVLRDLWLGWGV